MSNDRDDGKYWWRSAMLAAVCVSATLCLGVARAQETAPDPRLLEQLGIMSIHNGLDARNNRIDALIYRFGLACQTEPPLDMRPCRIEAELLAFLRALPADRDAIARELGALGAICRKQVARLDCLYERNVHSTGWVAGHAGPAARSDDLFRINFVVTSHEQALGYEVEFHQDHQR